MKILMSYENFLENKSIKKLHDTNSSDKEDEEEDLKEENKDSDKKQNI